jgi:hypothetical protein
MITLLFAAPRVCCCCYACGHNSSGAEGNDGANYWYTSWPGKAAALKRALHFLALAGTTQRNGIFVIQTTMGQWPKRETLNSREEGTIWLQNSPGENLDHSLLFSECYFFLQLRIPLNWLVIKLSLDIEPTLNERGVSYNLKLILQIWHTIIAAL